MAPRSELDAATRESRGRAQFALGLAIDCVPCLECGVWEWIEELERVERAVWPDGSVAPAYFHGDCIWRARVS